MVNTFILHSLFLQAPIAGILITQASPDMNAFIILIIHMICAS